MSTEARDQGRENEGRENEGREHRADGSRETMLQRALRRFTSSNAELESEELQERVRHDGAVPIRNCEDRQQVSLTGTIATVTIHPRAGHPALEVELRDGSGGVTLVWLGRRRIAGIDPGRTIKVAGRISCHDGRRLMYNPRYELVSAHPTHD